MAIRAQQDTLPRFCATRGNAAGQTAHCQAKRLPGGIDVVELEGGDRSRIPHSWQQPPAVTVPSSATPTTVWSLRLRVDSRPYLRSQWRTVAVLRSTAVATSRSVSPSSTSASSRSRGIGPFAAWRSACGDWRPCLWAQYATVDASRPIRLPIASNDRPRSRYPCRSVRSTHRSCARGQTESLDRAAPRHVEDRLRQEAEAEGRERIFEERQAGDHAARPGHEVVVVGDAAVRRQPAQPSRVAALLLALIVGGVLRRPGHGDDEVPRLDVELARPSMSSAARVGPSWAADHAASARTRSASPASSSARATARRTVAGETRRPGSRTPSPAQSSRAAFSPISAPTGTAMATAPECNARTSVP